VITCLEANFWLNWIINLWFLFWIPSIWTVYLRFRLRLAKFDYTISHIPGKLLYALSRAPTSPVTPDEDNSLQDDAELLVDTVVACLPAIKAHLATYINGQKADHTLIQVGQYCQDGWPSKHEIDPAVKPY